jgi:hypothetical protein
MRNRPCHSTGGSCHGGGPGSIPGKAMWDLQWTSGTGTVFSEYFGFPCQFSFHRLLHIHHLSSGAATIDNLVADVPSGLSLTSNQESKKKWGTCDVTAGWFESRWDHRACRLAFIVVLPVSSGISHSISIRSRPLPSKFLPIYQATQRSILSILKAPLNNPRIKLCHRKNPLLTDRKSLTNGKPRCRFCCRPNVLFNRASKCQRQLLKMSFGPVTPCCDIHHPQEAPPSETG